MKKSLFFSVYLAASLSVAHAETVKIYAAASLTNAITDLKKIYQKQYPKTNLVPVYGASSALAKQVEAGASSDIFFSADLDWMNYLIKKNLIHQNSAKPLLFNQLVVISPKNLNIPFKAQSGFNFAQSFKGHLCTGQMESVPAGKYAKQSLIKLNWLERLKGRIVGTDDVRSALAFVERGECEVGIVYKTDALISQKVKIIGTFPADSHHPIIYPIALTKQGEKNAEAIQFEKFIKSSPQAKSIFQKYGFRMSHL
ncbi:MULTISPECIES: molybdate ABC transporter substrate-binding protein [Acinetobacter Taxon 24D]|jgi:molybdate transport system substrate-binding protein|uniref:molybdate ABC transporter substrate-binding protein n=1 Tax=Acinetobacter Taxon 24D TaxID=2839057 RepID=UPI0010387D96|nr:MULTISPECIES: molybdate ABC transporter substrate-binding protein [Acinetobacter Taxon 24D]NNG81845.1 molybdate ABC transporter substrate-binding protein [Acinetobacter sp. ANC 5378]TCH63786.1 molybdate ABC transporter substrate-binding protein [Acinetobacter sp. ANC 4862]